MMYVSLAMVTMATVTWLSTAPVGAELFTALADMEELLPTEAVLINTLHRYITVQERKLDLLRRYSKEFQKQYDDASTDVTDYVANPINAYLLVKRLTTDWKQVEELMSNKVGEDFIANITAYRAVLKFPTEEDLNGAAVALTRLQDTYKLDTASLARGELNGIQYSSELTAGDCFELGRQAYNNGDYYHTVLWMQEAKSRLGRETNETTLKSDILDYMAFSTYKQGNTPLALQLTKELLEIIPNHERALRNKANYEEAIAKITVKKREGGGQINVVGENVTVSKQIKRSVDNLPYRDVYEMLCRGDVSQSVKNSSLLKCMYVHNNNPFLRIAPFKIEEAHAKPRIVIFHEIMSDAEIQTIKKMALPRFQRAKVQNYKTGEPEVAQYRISKSAWLKDNEHKHIANVCRRVQDMTGLTVETAEDLQVVNYGIGGHYEPHFDFTRKEDMTSEAFMSSGTGNRIATVLFYMSDVPQGGATVFPHLRTALWPKKGTAAFWHNLYPSGQGDYFTRHAACPVLAGSKWVSNKWFHEKGQEFRRPCDLTQDPLEKQFAV